MIGKLIVNRLILECSHENEKTFSSTKNFFRFISKEKYAKVFINYAIINVFIHRSPIP